MDILNKAKKIEALISSQYISDIMRASYHFDDLDELYNISVKLTKEIELIRASCRERISTQIKSINAVISLYENENTQISDLLKINEINEYEIAPNIKVRAIELKSEDEIPDTPIYYVNGSFATKINGTVISGNIRNIHRYSSKTVSCRNHPKCKKLSECKWGHDDDFTWSAGNFLYTPDKTVKTRHMRHVGNRDTLSEDMAYVTDKEKKLRTQQTAHDILICLALSRKDSTSDQTTCGVVSIPSAPEVEIPLEETPAPLEETPPPIESVLSVSAGTA